MTSDEQNGPFANESPSAPRRQRRALVGLGLALGVLVIAGLVTGLTMSLGGRQPAPAVPAGASYDYYQSVIGRYGSGPMMGGGDGWTANRAGYVWMMGGTTAPEWMQGHHLPGFMMDGDPDPGTVMGRLFADAPGPRVSPSEATRLGEMVPSGATADPSGNRLTFTTKAVHLVVLASPSMPAENFRIAGMTNPTVVVPEGAHVSIDLVNADESMAHGLVVTATGTGSTGMPMMSAPPAFDGAAVWFLGESTSAGMHEGALSFTATAPGTYQYLCPVPGHAQEGMEGTFVVAHGN